MNFQSKDSVCFIVARYILYPLISWVKFVFIHNEKNRFSPRWSKVVGIVVDSQGCRHVSIIQILIMALKYSEQFFGLKVML